MRNEYLCSRFPESLYPVTNELESDYMARCHYGFEHMTNSSITIGILARDLEEILPYTLARLKFLRSLFSRSVLVAYENDSIDNTKQLLHDSVDLLLSEDLKWPVNVQNKSVARKKRMAYYRNKCRDLMLRSMTDYYMVYDADVVGGASYEGIANSFSYDWDVCGSNSLLYDTDASGNTRRVYYDTWAWRDTNVKTDDDNERKNNMVFNRGESPIVIDSCFGGLALYKADTFRNPKYKYEDYDCDHVTFHRKMIEDGKRIIMNPSQLVIYNKTRYVI